MSNMQQTHHADRHDEHHVVPLRSYLAVYIALMLLLVVTVVVAYLPLGPLAFVIAMLVASIKSVLILLIFMHVKYTNDRLTWIFAGMGYFMLFVLFSLVLSDYIFRGGVGVPGK